MLFPPTELGHVVELAAKIWLATRPRLETRLRPLSMTWPQFGAMLSLLEADGVTQRELGELLGCDRTTMSVICDSLERHGWAERRQDPADRRAKRVSLTDTGRDAIKEAQRVVWGAYTPLTAVLSSEEVATTAPLLERVLAAIESVPNERPSDCVEAEVG